MNQQQINGLTSIKMFITAKLLTKNSTDDDDFLMELSSWTQAQMSDVKNTTGSERTKHIRAFFRGMKKK